MAHPYVLTDDTLMVYVGAQTFTVPRSHPRLDEILGAVIAEDDAEEFSTILEPAKAIAAAVESQGLGEVEVTSNSVLYNGAPVADVLIDRVLDIVDLDLPLDPWVKFIQNLYANPYLAAREELYLFLEGADLPITDDGCFLAFKAVRDNFKDHHSGTFDNSVGQVVSMPRELVDKDRRNTCSVGLHFCSKGYLRSFYHGSGHCMVVKVNPADVVSIPADYSNTKGRTWRYEVVGEIPWSDVNGKNWAPYDTEYTVSDCQEEDWEDWEDWEDDEDVCDCEYCLKGEEDFE